MIFLTTWDVWKSDAEKIHFQYKTSFSCQRLLVPEPYFWEWILRKTGKFIFPWPGKSLHSLRQRDDLPFCPSKGQVWSKFTVLWSLVVCGNVTLLLYLWFSKSWMLNVKYSQSIKVFQFCFSEHESTDSKRTRLLFQNRSKIPWKNGTKISAGWL